MQVLVDCYQVSDFDSAIIPAHALIQVDEQLIRSADDLNSAMLSFNLASATFDVHRQKITVIFLKDCLEVSQKLVLAHIDMLVTCDGTTVLMNDIFLETDSLIACTDTKLRMFTPDFVEIHGETDDFEEFYTDPIRIETLKIARRTAPCR